METKYWFVVYVISQVEDFRQTSCFVAKKGPFFPLKNFEKSPPIPFPKSIKIKVISYKEITKEEYFWQTDRKIWEKKYKDT